MRAQGFLEGVQSRGKGEGLPIGTEAGENREEVIVRACDAFAAFVIG